MEWQPIHTAPKDGTDILICEVIFEPSENGFVCLCFIAAWEEEQWMEHGCYPERTLEPTHWMSLPLPPKLEYIYDRPLED
jgi:hypothetical protein